MATEKPIYDLVLLLDANAEDERRAEIRASVESLISKQGELLEQRDWGMRRTAYEIEHANQAEYHLLQFHGPAELLRELDRILKIADGVMRFRIIKLKPGTPSVPDLKKAPVAAASDSSDS